MEHPIRGKLGDVEPIIVVTGCGRSGTSYITRVFQNLGLKVAHEKWGQRGMASWYIVAGGHYENFLKITHNRKVVVLHQVREPLKVVSSFIRRDGIGWITRMVPEINAKDNPFIKCAKYWYYWNKMVESKFDVDFRYKVEDVSVKETGVLKKICELVGVEFTDDAFDKIGRIPTNVHTGYIPPGVDKKKTKISTSERKAYTHIFTWKELKAVDVGLYKKLKVLADIYGYA